MITKKVNRYYCEYCTKSNCSAGAMSKHEKHCTKNPDRKCGMCDVMEEDQQSISDMLALFPPIDTIKGTYENDGYSNSEDWIYTDNLQIAIKNLRDLVNNCPACILAAIRQAGIPVPLISDFDYKKEVDEIWDKMREQDAQNEYDSMLMEEARDYGGVK